MLERTQVFVDTSYLLASFYNSWEEGARTQLEIDLPEVCSVLDRMITQQIGQPIQRQNWYDGIPDSGPHRYQRALRTVDGVQLRAGLLIETGQRRTQKAVDTRLVADMVLCAVRQQCSDIVLVSGDQDMIPGVVEASNMGVRVHLYGFSWDSMSNALRHKCDSITVLDPREDFAQCMQIQPLEGPIPPQIPPRVPGESDTGTDTTPDSNSDSGKGTDTDSGTDSSASPATSPEAASTEQPDDSANSDEHAGTQATAATHSASPAATSATSSSAPQPADDTAPAPAAQPQPGATTAADAAAASPEEPQAASTAQQVPPTAQEATGRTIPRPGQARQNTRTQSTEVTEVNIHTQKISSTTTESSTVVDAEIDGLRIFTDQQSSQAAAQSGPSPADIHPGSNESADTQSAAAPQPAQPAPIPEDKQDDDSTDRPSVPKPSEMKPISKPAPSPSMMASRRKLRSRYVPLPNEVWTSAGFQTPFDVGQQYATWWFHNVATDEQRDSAHVLSGGGLPPNVDRPLLQFACEALHEYTLSESQRVSLRDGFHTGIRAILITGEN